MYDFALTEVHSGECGHLFCYIGSMCKLQGQLEGQAQERFVAANQLTQDKHSNNPQQRSSLQHVLSVRMAANV